MVLDSLCDTAIRSRKRQHLNVPVKHSTSKTVLTPSERNEGPTNGQNVPKSLSCQILDENKIYVSQGFYQSGQLPVIPKEYYDLVWRALSFLDNPLTYTYIFNYTVLALYPKPKTHIPAQQIPKEYHAKAARYTSSSTTHHI